MVPLEVVGTTAAKHLITADTREQQGRHCGVIWLIDKHRSAKYTARRQHRDEWSSFMAHRSNYVSRSAALDFSVEEIGFGVVTIP
jgi:ectoine hydroxylase-related dioxygenase (phytanoyl-CoA dioxygenase family)